MFIFYYLLVTYSILSALILSKESFYSIGDEEKGKVILGAFLLPLIPAGIFFAIVILVVATTISLIGKITEYFSSN